jgi:hypothetical protein
MMRAELSRRIRWVEQFSTHGINEKCKNHIVGKPEEQNHLEDLDVDGRNMLK